MDTPTTPDTVFISPGLTLRTSAAPPLLIPSHMRYNTNMTRANLSLQLEFPSYGKPSYQRVLISLHEEWHNNFLSGQKQFEFRRRYVDLPTTAAVYVSGKQRALCALAKFDTPISGKPRDVISQLPSHLEGSFSKLLDYFGSRTKVYALPLQEYSELTPVPLEVLRQLEQNFHPPQSYLFLDRKPHLLDHLSAIPDWRRHLD